VALVAPETIVEPAAFVDTRSRGVGNSQVEYSELAVVVESAY
jgi:hypothetical protein